MNQVRQVSVIVWVIISSILYGMLSIIGSIISRRTGNIFARVWARQWLASAGVSLDVRGLDRLNSGERYVFIVNHQSSMDIPVLYSGLPGHISFMAKKELFWIPILGWGMAAVGHIAIDRSNARNARKSIQLALARLKREAMSLVIFPEGTRSPDGNLQQFKKAAFGLAIETGAEIVPVAISGVRDVQPKGSFFTRSGKIVLNIGNPIPVQGKGAADKLMLAEEVKEKIRLMMETA